jgi:formylglycine-generating enzyme required for sulfatase activity
MPIVYDLNDMVLIPGGKFEMGDSKNEGASRELPVHTVTLDSFAIGKCQVTNHQYCQYLNSALDSSSIVLSGGAVCGSGNNQLYCHTSTSSGYSQIDYSVISPGVFSVRTKSGRDMSNDPMVTVSWYGAAAYCNWLSQQEEKHICYNTSDPNWPSDFNKKGYRLPTEAEWEYAARGGLPGGRFPWGDEIYHTQANYGHHPLWNDGIFPLTSPVGFFDGTLKYKEDYQWPASDTSYETSSGLNGYGLYDMAGNVWEWCNDWYGAYSSSPQTNPNGPASGNFRVARGGNWEGGSDDCGVARRDYASPYQTYFHYGFRVVLAF